METSYKKLSDTDSISSAHWHTRLLNWIKRIAKRSTPELSTPHDVRVRVKKRLKDINNKINFWEKRMGTIAQRGKKYLKTNQDVRAQAETRVYTHLRSAKHTLIHVQTKLRLLLQEMDRIQTLHICMNTLKEGTDALQTQLNDAMSISDIDHMMVKWDRQITAANDISRAMTQTSTAPMDAVDDIEEDPEIVMILNQWRLEALDNAPLPTPMGKGVVRNDNNARVSEKIA